MENIWRKLNAIFLCQEHEEERTTSTGRDDVESPTRVTNEALLSVTSNLRRLSQSHPMFQLENPLSVEFKISSIRKSSLIYGTCLVIIWNKHQTRCIVVSLWFGYFLNWVTAKICTCKKLNCGIGLDCGAVLNMVSFMPGGGQGSLPNSYAIIS